jgi:hypothetical protein
MTRYVVETAMGSGWDACWTEDGVPMTFASREAAQSEIDELLLDTLHFDEPYAASDYRIVAVPA